MSSAPGSATGTGPGSNPAAISLLSFLQTELLVLSNEARRKNPEIKDALDKVFAWLRELKESPVPVDITAELGKSHDLLVPLLLASRTGQPKMLSIAVSCLHRLITFNALSLDHDTAEVVFEVLTEAVKGTDEIQQKSLMCVMPLLANSVSNIHGPQLVQAYLIGFRLHELASSNVKNAAVAIVRQLIIWLFEQVAEEDAHGTGDARPYADDAFAIFQDICLLLNDEKAQVLALNSIDKSFALELIESVLAFHSLIFRQHPEYVTIVREKICTVAIRSFTEGSSFPHTSRLWRVVGVLLRDFHDLLPLEAEIFISFLPRILDDDAKAEWEKNLVLETCRDIFSDHGLMLELFEICDRRQVEGQVGGPKVFQDIIVSVCNHMGKEARRAAEAGTEVDYSQADIKISLLSQFDKDHAPSVPPLYSLHLSFESMNLWIQGMLQVLLNPSEYTDTVKSANMDCKDLLEKTWRVLTSKGLFSLYGTSLQYEWRRLLFAALEDLGRITCLFEMPSQLQHLIESLFQLDPSMHLYPWQSILTISIEYPSMIQGTWPTIVKVLRSVDVFTGMKARKISYSTAITTPVPLSALESPAKKVIALGAASPAMTSQVELDKIASLSGLAKELVDKSVQFDEATFTAFIRALAEGASQSRNDLSLINRLRQATLKNVGRFLEDGKEEICEAWNVVQQALLVLLSLEDGQIRGQAIEFLGSLCQGYMSVNIEAFKSHLGFQTRLILLLRESSISPVTRHQDVDHLVMDVSGKLIQSVGPVLLLDAWYLLFQFLADFLDTGKGTDLQLLRATFYCAKLVASDFLPCLGDKQLESLLGLLKRFAQQTDDLNIALTAIGLLWDISDFLRLALTKHSNVDGFALWLTALDLLVSTSTDARPELRNSAVQTLTRTVELFALSIKPGQWDKLLCRILLPLLTSVCESAETSHGSSVSTTSLSSGQGSHMVVLHHTRDSASKQWDETLVLVVQGTVKIFSDCLPTLSSLADFDRYWDSLMTMLERSCEAGKSIEVVSVSLACFKHTLQALQRIENGSETTWTRAWQTWHRISSFMCPRGERHESFTQESLDIFAGCLGCFLPHFAPKSDLEWLKSSMAVLDGVLQCRTPSDMIKDTEQISPLQHTVLQQVQSVDYGGYGLEAKVHLARQLASWMELAPELKSLEMTRVASVRRHRHSVAPSRPSLSPLLPTSTKGQATYIALSLRLLSLIEGYFTKWKTDADIYHQAYTTLIRAVGRLMVLKYRAASPSSGESAWKIATRTLNSIFLATPKDLLDSSCWSSIVEVLEKSLESSRRMVPVELAVDELNADEDFDIEQVGFIKEHVLPEMQLASEETVSSLLVSLERSSHLYYTKSDSPKLTTIEVPQSPGPSMNGSSRPSSTNPLLFRPPPSSTFPELVPVIKERFAIRCLQTLFDICSSTSSPILAPNVVKVALRILLKRTKSVMQVYVEEKRLQGGMPFPRVRQDEMLFVLSASVSLRITKGLAAEALLPTTEGGDGDEEKQFDQKRHLFSTDIGHLFYLYPTLCSVMEITDPEISDLIRQAFTTIGQSCHLIP